MNPRYPVFIPSKGRSDELITMKMFDDLGVDYTVFVEEQEYDAYAKGLGEKCLQVLPHRDKGLTATRNVIWDYAAGKGYKRFWTFDDNIRKVFRFNRNRQIPCSDGSPLAIIEDFVDRYSNVVIAGMHYFMFLPRKQKAPPYQLNSRVYSNMLIDTFAESSKGRPYRNELFFNDDTDLCLRVLKDGYCTLLINAFLVFKITTMRVKGGMTTYYKQTDKRKEFVEELQKAHPDCVHMIERWGRWHHWVDYQKFRQPLVRREGVVVPQGVNNHGLILEERIKGIWTKVNEDGSHIPKAAPSNGAPEPVAATRKCDGWCGKEYPEDQLNPLSGDEWYCDACMKAIEDRDKEQAGEQPPPPPPSQTEATSGEFKSGLF